MRKINKEVDPQYLNCPIRNVIDNMARCVLMNYTVICPIVPRRCSRRRSNGLNK